MPTLNLQDPTKTCAGRHKRSKASFRDRPAQQPQNKPRSQIRACDLTSRTFTLTCTLTSTISNTPDSANLRRQTRIQAQTGFNWWDPIQKISKTLILETQERFSKQGQRQEASVSLRLLRIVQFGNSELGTRNLGREPMIGSPARMVRHALSLVDQL